jgi:uncharacterized protein
VSASIEQDICFDVDGTATHGTLRVPAHREGRRLAAAAKVAMGTRVLVTDGTADTNIPVSTISPLASALKGAGTTGPGLKVLTGINHLLHTPGTTDNDAVLAPSVVAALRAWAQPFAAAG